ncbi:MAG TPA: class GN sortase [Candidatus Polarisedimenticolia bacterium]|jgi:sortase A|nr:class GN sortase [Candidatus Polarisedimenticolia bacterium]
MTRRAGLVLTALLLLVPGGLLLGRRGYLEAKAAIASCLIDRALEAHLRDGRPHRPWPWADMHPIAVMEVERLGVRRAVLRGATGESLAFGAGHVDGTASPNAHGHSVLAGHRDRGFAFLRDLRPGDGLRLRTSDGVRDYLVDGIRVVTATDVTVMAETPEDRLTLVTCYPFGGLLRSRLRYVVTAAAAHGPTAMVVNASGTGSALSR